MYNEMKWYEIMLYLFYIQIGDIQYWQSVLMFLSITIELIII